MGPIQPPSASGISAISFPSPNVGFASCPTQSTLSPYGLFKPTDGGTTWISIQHRGSPIICNDIYFHDIQRGFIIGYDGLILGTTIGGVSSVELSSDPSKPLTHRLSSNFPNPFNSTTNFSFSTSSQSFVSLRVYDLLGKEVATVVSEGLPAGNYSRKWNAFGLASGVYFYRLQVGSFTETKKLILLR